MIRRYETLRTLLLEVFGVDEATAAADACLMEHAVSPQTMSRITRFLDLLHRGESFDLEGLQAMHRRGTGRCSSCVAAGFCQAAEAAVH